MAVRLPVVLCQHPRRSGSHSEHEESWITRLLFEERLDATLVADLATIPLNSTDQLCLEGFKGGFLLLSWQSAESVAEHLQRLGICPVDLVPVAGGPKISVTPAVSLSEPSDRLTLAPSTAVDKKIYYMHLDLGRTIDAGVRELKALLASLSTPVFQLQSLAPSARGASPAKMKSPAPQTPSTAGASDLSHQSALTSSGELGQISPGKPMRAETGQAVSAEKPGSMDSNMDDEFPNIDSLVRELDDLDL